MCPLTYSGIPESASQLQCSQQHGLRLLKRKIISETKGYPHRAEARHRDLHVAKLLSADHGVNVDRCVVAGRFGFV